MLKMLGSHTQQPGADDEVKAPDGGATTSSSLQSEQPSSDGMHDLESGRYVTTSGARWLGVVWDRFGLGWG